MNQSLRSQVEQTLECYPETRNSDIALTIQIWHSFYSSYLQLDNRGKEYASIQLLFLYELPREDNIRRLRAQIQNQEKEYLPTSWEIAKQRGINEDVWKKSLGYFVENSNQMRFV